MRRNLKRLLLASCLSLFCFAMTSYWYHSTGSVSSYSGDKKPVAYVERVKDEIHRRPVTRIIWQLINDGEPVYPGEAIRTSSIGEVRIQFAESSRFIDLESDSLIVISQSAQNEISLDLLDGGVTVNQGTDVSSESSPALTLKSGEAKVDLSQATASLSKSNGGNINLRVLEGKAKIEDPKGQSQEVESGSTSALGTDPKNLAASSLQILSPSLDLPFSFNPENPQPVVFSWKGFPDKSLVSLHVGPTRKSLKPVSETPEEKITHLLAQGKYYWKLVAKDPTTKEVKAESALYRLDVVPRIAPSLVSPAANEKILKISSEQKIDFRWIVPNMSQKVLLEVAKDPALKDKILSQEFTQDDQFLASLPEGEFYVRLSAQYDSKDSLVSSPIQKFSFSPKSAPQPLAVNWISPVSTAPQYYVDRPEALVSWTMAKPEANHPAIKTWKVKWAENEFEVTTLDAHVIDTQDLKAKISFEKPGRYFAQIEGLDQSNQTVAISNVQSFEVAPLPLLPAPQLVPGDGDLNADNQGRLDLKWTAIEGAREYKVILYDRNGVEKRSATFKKTSTTLVNLLPGEHKVEVQAIDAHGRSSQKETPRMVRVPASSGLMSPKIRKMKVN